jgi:hypothetical protein
MPLQKLQFRPGVNREGTTLANEGGWFESDKIRFRSGFPEKIGGWVTDTGTYYSNSGIALQPPTNSAPVRNASYWGVCRSMWNWSNLSGINLLGLGTNLKYYIQGGANSYFYDVTPLRVPKVTISSNAFTTINGSTTVQVNDTAHGAQTGDFVTISGVSGAVNGISAGNLNKEFRVTYKDANAFYITVASPATSGGTTGAADFEYQITTGLDIFTFSAGWGAGGWGGVTPGATNTGWGDAASQSVGQQLRLWSESNYGEDLIINYRGGGLYYWANNANPNIYDRAQTMAASATVVTKSGSITMQSTAPTLCNFVMVSDASRFVICFGTNDPTGAYATTALDPLQIRWSNQEQFNIWTPAATNQAGDYRLSNGSTIITAQQTRQEILVWTNAAIYSMQYLGPPYVWGFQIMGDNISIAGPNVASTANNVTYWMGVDKFYMYSGRVETLPCTLRQYVYDDINMDQQYQFFSGTNEGYNEIWWFYCSITGTSGTGTPSNPNVIVDRYVVFNHLERTWYYGNIERTAWLDSPLRPEPMATTYAGASDGGLLVYHETGNDDGVPTTPAPITSYCQSSDFDIGDGHNFGLVSRIIPDVTFDGSDVAAPTVTFGVRPRQAPGANYGSSDYKNVTSVNNYSGDRYYEVQQFTQYVYVRIRGRQMAFRIGSTALGVSWQLGTPRIDVRPDGRR